MPGLEPEMFFGVLHADWKQIKERSERVARRLTTAKTALILSAGANRLEMSLEGREGMPDTGIISPGEVGNLPGGEAFIAPVEGTASGRIAVGPRQAPAQWVLVFREGRLAGIEGSPPFEEQLRDLIAKEPRTAILAELGVGTNESATSTESTLEAEKILGTVHVAIGDNFSFGGQNQVGFHKDFICFKPTLVLEHADKSNITVVKEGNFAL
jgi:leucyl aminopeptidase (aminopeptidase T)